MMMQFPNWNLGFQTASLAFRPESVHDLICNQLAILYLDSQGNLWFLPDGNHDLPEASNILASERGYEEQIEAMWYRVEISPLNTDRLLSCCEYSVFEISDDGRAWLAFDASSRDHTLFVTGHCNSNCLMCPCSDMERQSGPVSNIPLLRKRIRHIPVNSGHFTITGGEPFLVGEEIFPLFKELKEKFIYSDFLLLTNGRIFCLGHYVDQLKESLPLNTLIGIPIHGSSVYLHDSISRAPGSFVQTMEGIRKLIRAGFRIEIRIVVSQLNQDDIYAISKLILSEFPEIETVKFIGLEMLGNAHEFEKEVWIPYKYAFSKIKDGVKCLLSGGIDVGIYNFPLCAVDHEFWTLCYRSITQQKIRYPQSCKKCIVQESCGGIFSGTYRLAVSDLQPILIEPDF